jgi:hypothetical protein
MVSVGANFLTKVGNGPTLALMFSAGGNIFTIDIAIAIFSDNIQTAK